MPVQITFTSILSGRSNRKTQPNVSPAASKITSSIEPSYPPAVIDILTEHCHLTPAAVMADIGAGTGLLTELFLTHGNRVFGVEPNHEMREAGERLLAGYFQFYKCRWHRRSNYVA